MFGKFVTAKLKGQDDCRQGAVICENPLVIRTQSGEEYTCDGFPEIVEESPKNCAICELPLAQEGGLCVKCIDELSPELKKLYQVFCVVEKEMPGTQWQVSFGQ